MIHNDTIIALATPTGMGAIAVIRISGPQAIALVSEHFQSVSKKDLSKQQTHTIHLGHIVDENRIVDEVLVSVFKNPQSYTGEDVVEISCHGSTYIQQEIIQLFIQKGCRTADAGEFTLRAFLNGKMDLTQAEAVADVIASNSEASHQMAMQQMRGGIANELQALREQLLNFTALIELELDFTEEDVEFANREQFIALVDKIIQVLKRLIDSFSLGNALKNGIPVAIIGEPNVGKSTLLNALLNEERAIVSDIAGTTRDAIEDEVIIDGVLFRFIDTAGIRDTEDIVENIGIQKAYEKAEKAQLIIYLIDASEVMNGKEDEKIKALISDIYAVKERFPNKRILIIANKIDNLSKDTISELTHNVSLLTSDFSLLLLSAKENIGVDALKAELTALVNTGALSNNETIITNSRHFEALTNALQSILLVKQGIDNNISSDLLSIDIRDCLRHLGTVTGEYDVDKDILGLIFSQFCIGK